MLRANPSAQGHRSPFEFQGAGVVKKRKSTGGTHCNFEITINICENSTLVVDTELSNVCLQLASDTRPGPFFNDLSFEVSDEKGVWSTVLISVLAQIASITLRSC